eukprot:m.41633 g.41633  ORF g.41633 m.41633 type:complete len:87 (-) comp9790_c0_seq2:940-1200(-)
MTIVTRLSEQLDKSLDMDLNIGLTDAVNDLSISVMDGSYVVAKGIIVGYAVSGFLVGMGIVASVYIHANMHCTCKCKEKENSEVAS